MDLPFGLADQPNQSSRPVSPLKWLGRLRAAIAPWAGLLSAVTLIGLWAITFWLASSAHGLFSGSMVSIVEVVLIILSRTFLQTGLFIVGHDAIHGSVLPNHPRVNQFIGSLVVTLYALLPYDQLSQKHWQHHRRPGRVGDPDYHDGTHAHPLAWYVHFMNGYLDGRQKWVLLVGMTVLFSLFWLGFGWAPVNLLLFWVLPILLSSIQLFYFGTYLPHRRPLEGYTNRHHARSNDYASIWSFLTCYHFGYHWEHHEYPTLPWYQLPSVRPFKP